MASQPREVFLQDEILLSGAKYQLIVAIEAAQAICNHLAARVAKEAPQSYADCFRILGRKGILSRELTPRLVDMAKFRNLLVHGYGKVDDAAVHEIIQKDIADLINYVREITLFLKADPEGTKANEGS